MVNTRRTTSSSAKKTEQDKGGRKGGIEPIGTRFGKRELRGGGTMIR